MFCTSRGSNELLHAQRRNARLDVHLEDEDLEIQDFIRMADNKDSQHAERKKKEKMSWQCA
jgi:hypothetical protein